MAVCANQCVRISNFFTVLVFVGPDGLGQVFKVHLVADACARWHNAEVVERALTPFEEGIAFHVTLIFAVHVHLESTWVAELVNHDRVVDDQINRVQRVDLLGVAAQGNDAVTHGSKVNNGWNTCEVLHQHAGRAVSDFAGVLAAFVRPFRECLDIVNRDRETAVFKTQKVLQDNFQCRGQF